MNSLYQVVIDFFTDDDWPFSEGEDRTIVRTGFKGDNGGWTCFTRIYEELEQVIFYSIMSVNVPEEKRQAMGEFLTRANYGLRLGNFEMDFSDGEVRYKCSIDVEDDALSVALFKRMVYANVITMDNYLPGMMALIYSDASPLEAIEKVEGQRSSDFPDTERNTKE